MNVLIHHLGAQYAGLADLIKQAHIGKIILTGNVYVRHGNVFARSIAKILNMPAAGDSVALRVEGVHTDTQMKWKRHFNEHVMQSCFQQHGEYLVEHMGPVSLWMKLRVTDNALYYDLHQARFWGIPLPGFLKPRLAAFEKEAAGYQFSVAIALPLVGLLIEYAGQLSLQPDHAYAQ